MWQVVWTNPNDPDEWTHEVFNTKREAEAFAVEHPGDPGDVVTVKRWDGWA